MDVRIVKLGRAHPRTVALLPSEGEVVAGDPVRLFDSIRSALVHTGEGERSPSRGPRCALPPLRPCAVGASVCVLFPSPCAIAGVAFFPRARGGTGFRNIGWTLATPERDRAEGSKWCRCPAPDQPLFAQSPHIFPGGAESEARVSRLAERKSFAPRFHRLSA